MLESKAGVSGYTVTPDIIDRLDQNPDLDFVGPDGRGYRVLMRENGTPQAPQSSVYVRVGEEGAVSYRVCGARSMDDALKGISLSFRTSVFQHLRERANRVAAGLTSSSDSGGRETE